MAADDPVERAVENARVSDRLDLILQAERDEREVQAQLVGLGTETRDAVKELVAQGRRAEERELERHRARAAREAQEELDRAEARRWWRALVSERVVVPVATGLGGALTALVSAAVAWTTGWIGP